MPCLATLMRLRRIWLAYLSDFLKIETIKVEIREIIKEAPSADQKLVTSSRSLHLAVNINIAALMTNENKPKVSRMAGSVNNLSSEPIRPFITPNKSATQRYDQAPPFTVMPEIKAVAAQKARALAIRRTSNFIN
jgi:hypothetical protein